jgi:hypothetical protein
LRFGILAYYRTFLFNKFKYIFGDTLTIDEELIDFSK